MTSDRSLSVLPRAGRSVFAASLGRSRPVVMPAAFVLLVILGFAADAGAAECRGSDATHTAGCYKNLTDSELERLLFGTATKPFDAPRVCGRAVETPDEVREVLVFGECRGFQRQALTLILNIRRSILFGDGFLGVDPAACYGVGSFQIVLRCGDVFVPDETTADPDDAVTVSDSMPVADLVRLASRLCELAGCPTSGDPCDETISKLTMIFEEINESRRIDDDSDDECAICPGDIFPPVISCPTGPLIFECESPDGAMINYRVTATDDCDPEPDVTCFPPPGTVLPAGTSRLVECEAKDVRGNVATCSFEVRVVDTTPPEISCPTGPIIVDCMPGSQDGAVVNYPAPTASDICDQSPEVVCDPPSGSFFPFGSTEVVCTATDSAGNSSQCTFEVRVVEETPTELFCSGDITVECTSSSGARVDYPAPMLSESCDPPPDPACDPPSGSIFPLGTTTVTCSTQDAAGNTISCSFTVTVVDTQPPTIMCPQNRTVECSSPDGTPVFFEIPAADVCDPEPVVTCNPPAGSVFPPGTTLVSCTATDASGNTSSCEFTITVVDTTPPQITCPAGPIVVSCGIQGDPPGAVVNYVPPVVTDNCDPDVVPVCDRASGSIFPLGSTTVTCTATDSSNNQSSCSFEVQVVDDAPPTLVCIGDIVRDCTSADGAIVEYPLPVSADECSTDLTVACDPPSGSLFPMGSTPVTCTATDPAGNVSSCSFTVTVHDITPPDIHCPASKVVECSSPAGTEVFFDVTATDKCDPEPIVACDPPSGSAFPPGVTTVHCTAMDRFGNTSRCSFEVSVVDTRPPDLVCPEDIAVECEAPEGTVVTFAPSAHDACEGDVAVTCDPPSGSVFPPGTTNVTCIATDGSGNEKICVFQVSVVDTTPPVIICSTDATVVECDQHTGGTVQFPLPAATDTCDPAPKVVCEPSPGSVLPLGLNTITCTATDSSGNSASCSFEIEVVDTAPPALVCVEDFTVECAGPDGALVSYPLPTATDICDTAPNLSCLPPPGSLFPIGDTTVTCTADDQSGNMISCSFTVSVVDTTAPVIQCPSNITVQCTSPNGTPVSYGITASDTCDPAPMVSCDPPSGTLFPLGTHIVKCTATDRAGNRSTCSFQVVVVDDIPPAISCPASFERECSDGETALVEYPLPSVADACDPAPVVVCDPPSGTRLALGSHLITCTATDTSGNASSCEFTVTVVDRTSPELICPGDIRAECEGPDGAVVDYALPVANDACEGQPPVSCSPPPGSLFQHGSTEVVCRSTDGSGNETVCTFVVDVVDTTPPEIICPEPIVVECASSGGTTVDFEVLATDLCDPEPVLSCDPPPGSVFAPGTTTVSCEAVDASGNRSTCTFTVTVADTTPPDVTCPGDLVVPCAASPNVPGWKPGDPVPPATCSTVVSYDLPEAQDTCQEEALQITCTPPPGSRLELGTHTVTCRVRDLSGNESTCTFAIEVVFDDQPFIRGDSNSDRRLNIADAVFTVRYLFTGGSKPACDDAADSNDDGRVNLADAIHFLAFQFLGGDPLPPPFGLCGFDPTPDEIECERFRPCE